jgi:putative membrane protein
MNASALLALPLADFDGHMDWDGGWWILMALAMIFFWGLVIAGIVWVVRELGNSHRQSAAAPDPLAVLDRRLAEGAISPDEYRERRAILTGRDPGAEG